MEEILNLIQEFKEKANKTASSVVELKVDIFEINEIENLINKNKELEKERDGIYADYQELGKEKLELEKMVELMNEYILKNCVSLEICSKQIGKECYVDVIYGDECKECVIEFFRKKAKGE